MCGVDVAQCGVNYASGDRKPKLYSALLAHLDRAPVF